MELSNKQLNQLMFRWSILTAGTIALLCLIRYLVTGSVPIITKVIEITPGWTYTLPFSISHWWDVLLGPICSIATISILKKHKDKDREYYVAALTCGMIIGTILGLIIGFYPSPIPGLFTGLLTIPSVLIIRIVSQLNNKALTVIGIGIELSLGLIFGTKFGLPWGLLFLFMCGILLALPIIEKIIKTATKPIGRWLIATQSTEALKTIAPKPSKIEEKKIRIQKLRAEAFQLEQEVVSEEPEAYRTTP